MPFDAALASHLLGQLGQQPSAPTAPPQMMPASVGGFHTIRPPQQGGGGSSPLSNLASPISALFATPAASLGAMAGGGAEAGGAAGAMVAAPETAALGGDAALGAGAMAGAEAGAALGASDLAALLPLLLL
jgi:hypothetical protein